VVPENEPQMLVSSRAGSTQRGKNPRGWIIWWGDERGAWWGFRSLGLPVWESRAGELLAATMIEWRGSEVRKWYPGRVHRICVKRKTLMDRKDNNMHNVVEDQVLK
jgi:hypothetical protein